MHHVGHQYGQRAVPTPYQPSQTSTPSGSITSSLRQWRKKDADRSAGQPQPVLADAAVDDAGSHVARVAPQAHYTPRPPSDPYHRPFDYGQSPVKFSEIVDEQHHQQQQQQKEKEYVKMCSVQQAQLMKEYGPPQAYGQYLKETATGPILNYVQKESQMVGQYQQKYNQQPYVRNYATETNHFLNTLNKLNPQFTQTILNDQHIRDTQVSMYQRSLEQPPPGYPQRLYRTSPTAPNYPYHPHHPRQYNHPQQYPAYHPSARLQQYHPPPPPPPMQQYPSPRRNYPENVHYMHAPTQCGQLEYAQHYQHRRAVAAAMGGAAGNVAPPDYYQHTARGGFASAQTAQEGGGASGEAAATVGQNSSLKQFLENWNEEDVALLKAPVRLDDDASGEAPLYVLDTTEISGENLPQYLHIQQIEKLPENIRGYYEEVDQIKPADKINVIENRRIVNGAEASSATTESVVNLHIVESEDGKGATAIATSTEMVWSEATDNNKSMPEITERLAFEQEDKNNNCFQNFAEFQKKFATIIERVKDNSKVEELPEEPSSSCPEYTSPPKKVSSSSSSATSPRCVYTESPGKSGQPETVETIRQELMKTTSKRESSTQTECRAVSSVGIATVAGVVEERWTQSDAPDVEEVYLEIEDECRKAFRFDGSCVLVCVGDELVEIDVCCVDGRKVVSVLPLTGAYLGVNAVEGDDAEVTESTCDELEASEGHETTDSNPNDESPVEYATNVTATSEEQANVESPEGYATDVTTEGPPVEYATNVTTTEEQTNEKSPDDYTTIVTATEYQSEESYATNSADTEELAEGVTSGEVTIETSEVEVGVAGEVELPLDVVSEVVEVVGGGDEEEGCVLVGGDGREEGVNDSIPLVDNIPNVVEARKEDLERCETNEANVSYVRKRSKTKMRFSKNKNKQKVEKRRKLRMKVKSDGRKFRISNFELEDTNKAAAETESLPKLSPNEDISPTESALADDDPPLLEKQVASPQLLLVKTPKPVGILTKASKKHFDDAPRRRVSFCASPVRLEGQGEWGKAATSEEGVAENGEASGGEKITSDVVPEKGERLSGGEKEEGEGEGERVTVVERRMSGEQRLTKDSESDVKEKIRRSKKTKEKEGRVKEKEHETNETKVEETATATTDNQTLNSTDKLTPNTTDKLTTDQMTPTESKRGEPVLRSPFPSYSTLVTETFLSPIQRPFRHAPKTPPTEVVDLNKIHVEIELDLVEKQISQQLEGKSENSPPQHSPSIPLRKSSAAVRVYSRESAQKRRLSLQEYNIRKKRLVAGRQLSLEASSIDVDRFDIAPKEADVAGACGGGGRGVVSREERIRENDLLMRRFLNKEKLTAVEVLKVKEIIRCKRMLEEINRAKMRKEREAGSGERGRRRRFRNLYTACSSDSQGDDDSEQVSSSKRLPTASESSDTDEVDDGDAGGYLAYQGQVENGIPKIIIKRRLRGMQPVVRIERSETIDMMAKRRKYSVMLK